MRNASIMAGITTVVAVSFLLSSVSPAAAADVPAPAVNVNVGIYLLSFGNYDPLKGTYLMDFYFWFRWNVSSAPAGFNTDKFEFMNGRATAKDRISDEVKNDTGEREVWYRVQASLYSDPQFKEYPFDQQHLRIEFEDANLSIQKLVYGALKDESGLDDHVKVAGWRMDGTSFGTTVKTYKWGEQYSRGVFEIIISREPTSTTIKTLLPPIVFSSISMLCFFFHVSKLAPRIALGTSMLISAVMFHLSQTASLPAMGSLILIDKIMISTYTLLGSSIVCTALVAIDEDFWKDRDYTPYTNRYGGLLTALLPFITFAALRGV